MKIDPICEAYICPQFSDEPTNAPADPMEKFLENAALAGAFGHRGHEHVARLHEETAQPVKRSATSDLDEPLTDDSQRLEKSGDRRKRSLTAWLRSELALGKSAEDLIHHAEQHDQDTADLLREIAAEL